MSATDQLREAAEQASEAAANFARIASEMAESGALDLAGMIKTSIGNKQAEQASLEGEQA